MPFVAINCGAVAESLLESELFGYEEGAFTGSRRGGHAGLFEAANRGTLFLDEIGEMPLALQTRLLRVLEEREVVRVGGTRPIPVDVRIVSATHCDLDTRIKDGRFRADLFYRLGVLRLTLPPLRERTRRPGAAGRMVLEKCAGVAGRAAACESACGSRRLRAAVRRLCVARQCARAAQPDGAPCAVSGGRTAAGADAAFCDDGRAGTRQQSAIGIRTNAFTGRRFGTDRASCGTLWRQPGSRRQTSWHQPHDAMAEIEIGFGLKSRHVLQERACPLLPIKHG